MSTEAPGRGVMCGMSYLTPVATVEVIVGLEDAASVISSFLDVAYLASHLVERAVNAENVVLRLARELEEALLSGDDGP